MGCPGDRSGRLRPLFSNSDSRSSYMGKGDQRSRRGKIYRGSFGKSRAKDPAKRRKRATAKK